MKLATDISEEIPEAETHQSSAIPLSKDFCELLYADALASELPRTKTVGSKWFTYREGTWQEVSRDLFRPQAQAVLPPMFRTARRESAILDHLEGRWQVDERLFQGAIAFESDAVLVNVANGVLQVTPDKIEFGLHRPDLHFTRALEARYDRTATCYLFETTLKQCLPDLADRSVFQLCCGNFLYPDLRFETALVCYGGAGRGKSTIAEPIAAVFGDGLLSRLSLLQLCDPRSYSLPRLRYIAVNLGTELDSLAIDDSGNFKTLLSGEPVEARAIYGSPFTLRTSCKLWFLANNLPRFKNGSEAELRRTRFLRFDYKPQSPDLTLKSRLVAERDGVLNFMLAGLQQLLSSSEIPMGSTESREVHERFRISNDPLDAFLRERCIITRDGMTRKETLVDAFAEFCSEHNLARELPEYFLKRLYEREPQVKHARKRIGDEGERIRVIEGIQLKGHL